MLQVSDWVACPVVYVAGIVYVSEGAAAGRVQTVSSKRAFGAARSTRSSAAAKLGHEVQANSRVLNTPGDV